MVDTIELQVREGKPKAGNHLSRSMVMFDKRCTDIVGEEFILELFNEMMRFTLVPPVLYRDAGGHGLALIRDVHADGVDAYLDKLVEHGFHFHLKAELSVKE